MHKCPDTKKGKELIGGNTILLHFLADNFHTVRERLIMYYRLHIKLYAVRHYLLCVTSLDFNIIRLIFKYKYP